MLIKEGIHLVFSSFSINLLGPENFLRKVQTVVAGLDGVPRVILLKPQNSLFFLLKNKHHQFLTLSPKL